MSHITFENLEHVFQEMLKTSEWKALLEKFKAAEDVWFVANGGLWSVANHQASDCSRLLDKQFNSLDNVSLLTSIANDYGYENLFSRWLESNYKAGKLTTDSLVVGMSCSGKSKNVLDALELANQLGASSVLFSGQNSPSLPVDTIEICYNVNYFHTVEVLCLMAFYELIHAAGGSCPSIVQEINRKYGD